MPSAETERSRTLLDKIWDDHAIADLGDGLVLSLVDRIVMHDRGGGLALENLTASGERIHRRVSVFGTVDHMVDTRPDRTATTLVPGGEDLIQLWRNSAAEHKMPLFDIDDRRQGIVHVIAPELGIALPGATVVCNDSHTCTLGGVGALGWGVGISDLEHALATGTVVTARPKSMRVTITGELTSGVAAKDVVLHLAGCLGPGGAADHVTEFAGPTVRRMSTEERLTLCNMSVELAARSALVAPDEVTFQSLRGAENAPRGELWDQALRSWRELSSDPGASFDTEVTLDCGRLAPQVTWGTSPAHVADVDGRVPDPHDVGLPSDAADRALQYMGLVPGSALARVPVDVAFIGSCTNSRLSDLRVAAAVLDGNKVAAGVQAICVPGSVRTKELAEREGLHRTFLAAGFEWREPGCSLCFFAGGETFAGQRVVTTTNRNFENRQGPGARSHLASPATVAASAVAGTIADPRRYLA